MVKELEEEHDTHAKFLADVKQMENDNEEAQLNAHLWLMLLLHEKIPSLLLKVQVVSEQMLHKAKDLQQQKDAATRREEVARESQKNNGIICGITAGAATGYTILGIFVGILCPVTLAVTIPAAVGSAAAAVLTGKASSQNGNAKVCENGNGWEIQSQINELESIRKKCQELLDGTAKLLSDQVAELMGQWKGRQSKL